TSHGHVALAMIDPADAGDDGPRFADGDFGPWMALDQALPHGRPDDDARLIAGRTAREILASLRAALATGRQSPEDIFALRADLRLHPDHAAELADALAGSSMTDPATQTAVSILVSTGGPAQQAALTRMVDAWARRDPNTGVSLVPALAQVANPTPETEAFLDHLRHDSHTDLANTALLAFGHVAARLDGDRA